MTYILHTNASFLSNDLCDVARMMLHNDTIIDAAALKLTDTPCDKSPDQQSIKHNHTVADGYWREVCTIVCGSDQSTREYCWTVPVPSSRGFTPEAYQLLEKRLIKRAAKQCLYYLIKELSGFHPPWGALTGIRPTRLYAERLAAGDERPEATIIARYDMRADKAALLTAIARSQAPYLHVPGNHVDIYVGIPYCVSRCAYCSFKTEIVPRDILMIEKYIDALIIEIEHTKQLMDEAGLMARALYMGGGTPTALPAPQLDRVLTKLDSCFHSMMEYTVEAGRPDTLDDERLRVLRYHPITRISINPQTMNDVTLDIIGRHHTAADTIDAYYRAKSLGFDNINMDLIAALPGETADDFQRTLHIMKELDPNCLTIHTLAIKRASKLADMPIYPPVQTSDAEAMVDAGAAIAASINMLPYYLYRQKHIAGNLENIGYAKPGKLCIYNIDMMEETTSILALGAGGISKRVISDSATCLIIKRAPNMMESARYIARLDEMINRKRALWHLPVDNCNQR